MTNHCSLIYMGVSAMELSPGKAELVMVYRYEDLKAELFVRLLPLLDHLHLLFW